MLFPKKGSVTGSLGLPKAEAGGGAPAFRGGTRGGCLGEGSVLMSSFFPTNVGSLKKKTKLPSIIQGAGWCKMPSKPHGRCRRVTAHGLGCSRMNSSPHHPGRSGLLSPDCVWPVWGEALLTRSFIRSSWSSELLSSDCLSRRVCVCSACVYVCCSPYWYKNQNFIFKFEETQCCFL